MIKVGKMNESINFKGLVNLANKNEDVSKHKDLGKACWQYLFLRIKDMARDLGIEDTNIIVKAIYDWIKKHETMNESLSIKDADNLISRYAEDSETSATRIVSGIVVDFGDEDSRNNKLKSELSKLGFKDESSRYGVRMVLRESIDTLSESAKISKMTRAMGQGYSGVWQLPSGTPGLFAEAGDMELVVLGDEEGVQIILQSEDDSWFKVYSTNNEKEAVAEFKKIAALMNDLVDSRKLAKKFGLTSM